MPPKPLDPAHKQYEERMQRHLEGFFRGHSVVLAPFGDPIINGISPDFAVAKIGPGPLTGCHVYVSVGAGLLRPGSPGLEFAILSPVAVLRQRLLLAMAAYYHHTEGLGLDHTMPIGEPWLPGSSLDHFFVSLPYSLGPDFEVVPGAPAVRILWLLPITKAERDLKVRLGAEALEQEFDRASIDFENPNRLCVATRLKTLPH